MKNPIHPYGDVIAIGVDMQNDFCPGGSLEVAAGDEAVTAFNLITAAVKARKRGFNTVMLTRDWHPAVTNHFVTEGGPWPVHCVADTTGAAFHPALDTDGAEIYSKGMKKDEDAYSGFMATRSDGTPLPEAVLSHTEKGEELTLIVGGLATDYCVKATAIDAARAGYDVVVPVDAVRAVDPATGLHAFEEMLAAGVTLTTTEQVLGRLA